MRTRRKVATAREDLMEFIRLAAEVQQEAEKLQAQLKGLKECIKASMQDMDVNRFVTPDGCEALVIESKVNTWDAQKLVGVLDPDAFDVFLPRKPDAKKLSELADRAQKEGDVYTHDELLRCCKSSIRVSCEIRPTVAAQDEVKKERKTKEKSVA